MRLKYLILLSQILLFAVVSVHFDSQEIKQSSTADHFCLDSSASPFTPEEKNTETFYAKYLGRDQDIFLISHLRLSSYTTFVFHPPKWS